jgi:hypothetical protein
MSQQKKPRARRTRRAVAAGSVATVLALGGAMAWNDAHATNPKTVVSATSSNGTSASGSDDSSSYEDDGWYSDDDGSASGSSRSAGSSSSSSSSTITPHTSTGGS